MSQSLTAFGTSRTDKVVISIDGMSGDKGCTAIVGGMALSVLENPQIFFIVHGDEKQLRPLIAKAAELAGRTEIRHTTKVIAMGDKPSHAMRQGKDSSMWNALETVEQGEATVAVSCGNTGALMAIAMLRLRKVPGVIRPAIACFWPSGNSAGWNVLLDVGADIRADADDLFQYAIMGASYARNALNIAKPRVGLLNVGVEEHKGRSELHDAAEAIAAIAPNSDFDYVGYVEGNEMASGRVDVIVSDGFSGNIALKTGEGTATMIRNMTRDAFAYSILSRIGALFAMTSLNRLSARIDPRNANGGVFLGLNGTVVKSHGGADAKGIAAAIKLAFSLAQKSFSQKLAARVAASLALRQGLPAKVMEV